MANISLRGLDSPTLSRIKSNARRRGVSVNRLIVENLQRQYSGGGTEFDDLDVLAGAWTKAEADAFAAHSEMMLERAQTERAKAVAGARVNDAPPSPSAWPFSVAAGAIVADGPLAGLVLVSRTPGVDADSATFLVRGTGLSATALGARVDRQLRAAGWQAVRHCDNDPALRFQRGTQEVRLRGTGTDGLAVELGAPRECR